MATIPTNPVPPIPAVPLPVPPTLSDPGNFDERGDAFVLALPAFQQGMNALGENAYVNTQVIFGKAESAAQSASTASIQASQAMGYRNDAGGYASTALAARDAAQGHAASVSSSLATVDSRLLGGRALPPTTNNQGGPIAVGTMYYNIGSDPALKDRWYIWSGTGWTLGPGDYTGAFLPLAGGKMLGPLKVRPGAMGEEAPQAQEVMAKAPEAWGKAKLMGELLVGFALMTTTSGRGADWPPEEYNNGSQSWLVETTGATGRAKQVATQVLSTTPDYVSRIQGSTWQRVLEDTTWSAWDRVITSKTAMGRQVTVNVPASTPSYIVDPGQGGVHVVTINATCQFILPAGRQYGDEVTLHVISAGAIRAITFSGNVGLQIDGTGALLPFPQYPANGMVSLIFTCNRVNRWECFYAGVH